MKVPELISRFPPIGLGIWLDLYYVKGETGVIRIIIRGYRGIFKAGVDLYSA